MPSGPLSGAPSTSPAARSKSGSTAAQGQSDGGLEADQCSLGSPMMVFSEGYETTIKPRPSASTPNHIDPPNQMSKPLPAPDQILPALPRRVHLSDSQKEADFPFKFFHRLTSDARRKCQERTQDRKLLGWLWNTWTGGERQRTADPELLFDMFFLPLLCRLIDCLGKEKSEGGGGGE